MSIRRLLAVGVALTCVASASAQVLLDEPFTYADNGALNAVWNANISGPHPTYMLDTGFGNPLPSYGMPTPTASQTSQRLARNLGGDFNGTDTNPLELSFDFYLSDAGAAARWNGARHFVELRGYAGNSYNNGALENLLAMGVFNTSDAPDVFNTNFYQGRVTNGTGWNTLDQEPGAIQRAVGWHRMLISVTGSQVKFSVDGVLCEVEPRPNAFGFDNVVLGSGLTANTHSAWVDNLKVEIVPEPASLSLLVLGGLIIARRRG